ncbi:hypothetical protein D3C80_1842120 [compost metagenome]
MPCYLCRTYIRDLDVRQNILWCKIGCISRVPCNHLIVTRIDSGNQRKQRMCGNHVNSANVTCEYLEQLQGWGFGSFS